MKRELGSTKKLLKAVGFQTVCAWLLATIVYQIGSRIENGTLNVANVIIILAIVALFVWKIASMIKKKDDNCSSCPYCDKCK